MGPACETIVPNPHQCQPVGIRARILPVYLDKSLGLVGEDQGVYLGFLYSSLSGGSLLGYVLNAYIPGGLKRHLLLGLLIQGVGFCSLAFVSSPSLAMVSVFVGGFSFGLYAPASSTIMQTIIDNKQYGRYSGISGTISGIISPLGRAGVGFATASFGIKAVFALMFAFYSMASFLSLGIRLKKVKD